MIIFEIKYNQPYASPRSGFMYCLQYNEGSTKHESLSAVPTLVPIREDRAVKKERISMQTFVLYAHQLLSVVPIYP